MEEIGYEQLGKLSDALQNLSDLTYTSAVLTKNKSLEPKTRNQLRRAFLETGRTLLCLAGEMPAVLPVVDMADLLEGRECLS